MNRPSRFFQYVAAHFLWATFGAGLIGPAFAVLQQDEAELISLREKIHLACRDESALHGAWWLNQTLEGKPPRWRIDLLVDSAREGAQKERLWSLIGPGFDLQFHALPLSTLLNGVRKDVQTTLKDRGRLISGAWFESQGDPKTIVLKLFGRANSAEDQTAIAGACDRILKADPAWSDFKARFQIEIVPDGAPLLTAADWSAEPRQGALAAIHEAIRGETELHGAWANLAPVLDHRGAPLGYDLYLVLDQARAGRQQARLEQLAARHIDREYRIVDRVELPFSRLLDDLRKRIAHRWQRGGRTVAGGYYDFDLASVEDLKLVLYGRIVPGTKAAVESECQQLLDGAEEAPWKRLQRDHSLTLIPDGRDLHEWSPTPESFATLKQIHDAIYRDRNLHGAWLDVAPAYGPRDDRPVGYDVFLRVDGARADAQRRGVEALLPRFLALSHRTVETTPLPITPLVNVANLRIESQRRFDGCEIAGVFLTPRLVLANATPDASAPSTAANSVVWEFRPYGRAGAETQVPELKQLVDDLLLNERRLGPYALRKELEPQTPLVSVLEANYAIGIDYYHSGLTSFDAARYDEAEWAFRQAMIEAPEMAPLRYSRVLALMQSGSRQAAFDHMLALVRRAPSPPRARGVLHALEKVQGPLRMEMMQMELQARAEPVIR